MKRSPILIVRSHQGRGLSVRPPSGYGEHIGAGLIEAGFQEGDEAVVVLRSELEALEKQAPKVWIILGKLDGAYEILAIWATEAAADAELQQILGRGRHGFQSVMVQEYLVDDVEPSRGKPE